MTSSKTKMVIETPTSDVRPDVKVQDPLNFEVYNAIAMDILETLQCQDLLAKMQDDLSSYTDFHQEQQQEREGSDVQEALHELQQGVSDSQTQGEQEPSSHDDGGHFRRRRLQSSNDEQQEHKSGDYGDDGFPEYPYEDITIDVTPTAQHLFCVAAASAGTSSSTTRIPTETLKYWTEQIYCPLSELSQTTLLELWSQARTELTQQDVLLQILKGSIEHSRNLLGRPLQLWAPTSDDGLEYELANLNDDEGTTNHGGLGDGLLDGDNSAEGGHQRTFVDVGSCLGLTSMAVAILYPHTRIVSIEAAAPNWLLQELNWNCNADVLFPPKQSNKQGSEDNGDTSSSEYTYESSVQVILGGVGPSSPETDTVSHHDVNHHHASHLSKEQLAKFLWRPQVTTSTRSWTPASERLPSDVELLVKLKSWKALLAEADIFNMSDIDVLNVNCQGCEYNLVPALTSAEFEAIPTVLGAVHWGYIPMEKLPSSKRAALTHERLCQHEHFARNVKECCAFGDMTVRSRLAGEILVQEDEESRDEARYVRAVYPKPATVADLAGDLCDNFDEWAAGNHLYTVESDWGWFQISSVAS